MVSLTTDATLNGGSITITIYEDTDGDGVAENTEVVSVPDGSNTTQLSNIQSESNTHWLYIDKRPGSVTSRTELTQASLNFVVQVDFVASGQGDGTGFGRLSVPVEFVASGSADGTGDGVLIRVRKLIAGGSASGTGSGLLQRVRTLLADGESNGTGTAVIEGAKRTAIGVKESLKNRIQIGTR